MRFSFNILALAAIMAGFTACNDGGSDIQSKPISDGTENSETPENAKPEKYDPAKTNAETPAGPTTTVVFDEYEYDFGDIQEPESRTHIFTFTNTGSEPLVISNCKGSCGCTVPQCPKDPILPGAKGEIEVKFNSKGKANTKSKTVTVTANTDPGQTLLKIKMNVLPEVK